MAARFDIGQNSVKCLIERALAWVPAAHLNLAIRLAAGFGALQRKRPSNF